VTLAMTYGNPSMGAAVEALAAEGVRRLLVLPLYPQYCSSTTGSVFDVTSRVLQRWRWLPEVRWVNDYHSDEGYIEALTRSILRHWETVGERSHLLFSYHGIPAAYVEEGDPYRAQAELTTRLVVARLGLADADFSHCYQSRFGSVVWLQPYTEDTLKALVKRGVRKVTVVSPSFAVDCLETLEEVALDYRDKFLALGGERLTLVPALNDDDSHAEVLAGVVENSWGVDYCGGLNCPPQVACSATAPAAPPFNAVWRRSMGRPVWLAMVFVLGAYSFCNAAATGAPSPPCRHSKYAPVLVPETPRPAARHPWRIAFVPAWARCIAAPAVDRSQCRVRDEPPGLRINAAPRSL
jgi:ferrochelatase